MYRPAALGDFATRARTIRFSNALNGGRAAESARRNIINVSQRLRGLQTGKQTMGDDTRRTSFVSGCPHDVLGKHRRDGSERSIQRIMLCYNYPIFSEKNVQQKTTWVV